MRKSLQHLHQNIKEAAESSDEKFCSFGEYKPRPVNVLTVRTRLGLNQTQFAARFGLSVATLRHWERGDRHPQGPALVLLNLIERAPLSVMQTLS